MKHVIWKMYYDYAKEEKWINEMAAKVLAPYSYSWGRYVFDDCRPGEFTYRIELLKGLPSSPEGRAYLNFLEETEIVFVSTYIRWVYLRKSSDQGSFDLYTDVDSRIVYYRNIAKFWTVIAFIECFAAAMFFGLGLYHGYLGNDVYLWNFLFGTVFLVLGCLFSYVGRKPRVLARELLLESTIRE